MPRQDIHQRIDWLWGLAREHSRDYRQPEADMARKLYRAEHPTHLMVLKCMDGRIHIPFATQTPLGIIEPFRNLGGMFHMGWPYLGEVVANSVSTAVDAGRRVLVMITYHFSKGDPHRGCAGFNHDTGASIRHVREVRRQMEHTFGAARQTVYPMVVGFETDEDALILHGPEGELNLAEVRDPQEATLAARVRALFPDMPGRILADLMPLVLGNVRHIAQVRRESRELSVEHREWMICVGRGFDFLHVPNMALIVGPYSPDLSDPLTKAAGIIQANMESGRIPGDGFLLLASAPYREGGADRARAELKARFLSGFADGVIRREHPALHGRMIRRTAVLHWETRELQLIGEEGGGEG